MGGRWSRTQGRAKGSEVGGVRILMEVLEALVNWVTESDRVVPKWAGFEFCRRSYVHRQKYAKSVILQVLTDL